MIIGIDAGSKFIKAALFDGKGECTRRICIEHHGNPEKTAAAFLSDHDACGVVVVTGHYRRAVADAVPGSACVDEIASLIRGAREFGIGHRYIVNVGAGSIKLVERDGEGEFHSYRENTLCAAGTGSFIDEQMHRLGFDYDMISAIDPVSDPPDIATRCAVFAKSDMIHRQQEGYKKEELWSGLCRGVVSTMLQSVFRGDLPGEEVLFCGGLFSNAVVRHWLSFQFEGARFHEAGNFLTAIGAVRLFEEGFTAGRGDTIRPSHETSDAATRLVTRRSAMPDFSAASSFIDNGSEVRLHGEISDGARLALGVDIGSTSTKMAVVDTGSKKVLADIYRKTEGNPLGAAAKLFASLACVLAGRNVEIVALGTTGSGRKLVGEIAGADTIVNEITAHYRGAHFTDPDIETIIEIGGQDSKYIRAQDGMVVDCNMNFVCAAGTGSFIEEQAHRLGFDIREVGEIVHGLESPHASDRCTVFMEQDINALLRDGFSREQTLAAVIRSIAKNYLNRVVGPRPLTGERIAFMGATARNRGLVAAFESLTGREIVVSPCCHVMGAFGAALIAMERVGGGESRFRGLDAFSGGMRIEYETCGECTNRCTITRAFFDNGREESWGYLCGKESVSAARPAGTLSHFGAMNTLMRGSGGGSERRGLTVGIPVVLATYNYLALWKRFFSSLGCGVILSSGADTGMKERAVAVSKTDFCFPMKIGLAHAHHLAGKGVDAIFAPALISEKNQQNGLPRVFCPYVISYPSIVKTLGLPVDTITPTIDFRKETSVNVRELATALGPYGFSETEIAAAFRDALSAHREFLGERFRRGREVLERVEREKTPAVVFIGRPYNLYDPLINLKIPDRLRSYGYEIFPYEMLLDPDDRADVHHMYWNFGEAILRAAEKIRALENVYPVYLTNFSCGPDSFILSRFEKAMAGKPYLIIELDEHASETGYVTRIEAFHDIIRARGGYDPAPARSRESMREKWRSKGRKLWIPPMHEITARLFAAGFRAYGYDAEALPAETPGAFELGKQKVRGSECLPATTTIGAFIRKLREIDARPEEHALFMPTAEGPCRFGQYAVLHRSILDANGYAETALFSPSSVNSYMGMSGKLRVYIWEAMVCADMVMKALCKTRPYELNHGETDAAAEAAIRQLEKTISGRGDIFEAGKRAIQSIMSVPVSGEKKPLVGIVGEIYVRCNPFCNNNVVRVIERCGGEAWLTPISEWVLYTSWFEEYFTRRNGRNMLKKFLVKMQNDFLFRKVHRFEEFFHDILADRFEPPIENVLKEGMRHLPIHFEGEAILTAGRAIEFLKGGADLVVNCAPFGCMPGNITASIFETIRKEYAAPVVTLFYDGESDVNRTVEVYLGSIANKLLKREPAVV